jgi:uncharacterized protein
MMANREFPDGMIPLAGAEFNFECHPRVDCFTLCCRNVDMILYPYDIVRLKETMGVDSEQFLRRFVMLEKGDNPFFPTVKLKLTEDDRKACPFLADTGCSVYQDRPTACRTYPLERAVSRTRDQKTPDGYYFKTEHPYCLGHKENKKYTVRSWLRNQRLFEHNLMNDLWAEMDTLFSRNPWKGEGAGGEKQKLAFLVCYNIDGFRRLIEAQNLLRQFSLDKDFRRRIATQDSELLKFGFEWLKYILTGAGSLIRK